MLHILSILSFSEAVLWSSLLVMSPETTIIKHSSDTGMVVLLLLVRFLGVGQCSAKLDGPWEGSVVLGVVLPNWMDLEKVQ